MSSVCSVGILLNNVALKCCSPVGVREYPGDLRDWNARGYIAGPGINPRHVDAILVKNYYEFFFENLGIDSTRDRYRESNFSPFASILKKKLKKKIASCT